jgi:hypothetical protein
MLVLALDQATKCGWAIGSDDGSPPHGGVWGLPAPGKDGDTTPLWLQMRNFLSSKCLGRKPDFIAFEKPVWIEGRATPDNRIHAEGLVCCIEMFAHDNRIECGAIDVHDWHPEFIGARHAPKGMLPEARRKWWKEQSILACSRRMWDCEQNDEIADAMGIWHTAMWRLSDRYEKDCQAAPERQKVLTNRTGAV